MTHAPQIRAVGMSGSNLNYLKCFRCYAIPCQTKCHPKRCMLLPNSRPGKKIPAAGPISHCKIS